MVTNVTGDISSGCEVETVLDILEGRVEHIEVIAHLLAVDDVALGIRVAVGPGHGSRETVVEERLVGFVVFIVAVAAGVVEGVGPGKGIAEAAGVVELQVVLDVTVHLVVIVAHVAHVVLVGTGIIVAAVGVVGVKADSVPGDAAGLVAEKVGDAE